MTTSKNSGESLIDSNYWLDIIQNDCGFYWNTQEPHSDNNETMCEFLEMLDEEIDVYFIDGTYAELRIDGRNYEVHASGNGDSFNHKIEFIPVQRSESLDGKGEHQMTPNQEKNIEKLNPANHEIAVFSGTVNYLGRDQPNDQHEARGE